MSLIPWKKKQAEGEPTESSPLLALREEMDRLFDAFIREPFAAIDWPWGGARWSPALDVAETDQEITVRAELPGIEAADLDLTIAGNQLVLSGEKKESAESQGRDFHQSESRYGAFRRALPLPEGVDTENVDAQFTNGVLTVHLKKTRSTASKKVDVKVKS